MAPITEREMTINFDVSRSDMDMIAKILDRAGSLNLIGTEPNHNDRLALMMDLQATHSNGCAMDFAKMLAADDFNFTHDFCGIHRHIDRTTGKLTGWFLPRCAAKQHGEAA